ncbi:MAG TPA: hypothetical protein ENH94_04825 [Phycisphaerales bacterium]|nr:hypothetical protein [Phycisphaerales bacterium]
MKWNSHDFQRERQIFKDRSYTPFGGTEVRHIAVWTRVKLGFLLMIGVEVANIHVDTKNSGVAVALAWVESMRKIPGMDMAWRAIEFAFGDSDDWICRECGCTDDDCNQCIEVTGQPCYWVEVDLCSRCKDEMDEGVKAVIEIQHPEIDEFKINGPGAAR